MLQSESEDGQGLGLETIDFFMKKLSKGFCYVYNPIKKCTRYYIIVDPQRLLTFRWSEIESDILEGRMASNFLTAAGGSALNWLDQSLIRENFLNSKNIKSMLVSPTVDKYIVENPILFDFKLLTEGLMSDPDTREPTQYSWKMGMGCEDGAHNTAANAAMLAEKTGGQVWGTKIDHAVYVERQNLGRDDTNYLTLTNYKLLSDAIFERNGGGRSGDHPSDHSAIYFDIHSSGRDTGHKLFSWNAEGFCNVIPWFTNSPDSDTITRILTSDNINFSEVYRLCDLLKNSVLSQEEILLGNKPIDTLISEASVISRTDNDQPGGFSSLEQWMNYISLFKRNNCKILMIQELFLKDYLKRKTLKEARLFADRIANFIIFLLRLNAGEKWEYKWDTYTGMILWSPDYSEVNSERIERNLVPISGERGVSREAASAADVVSRATTEEADLGVEEDFEQIDEEELVVYNSDSPKYSTFISLQTRDGGILNLVNIHLKALAAHEGYVHGASDLYDLHIYELQNIMRSIPHTTHQYYLIGDFNCEYVDQLMRNLFAEACDSQRRMRDKPSRWANLETVVGTAGKIAEAAAEAASEAAAGVAAEARRYAFDLGSVATTGLSSLMGQKGQGQNGGKKHKSTRRKRKSTRRKHKKTHKKSKRGKSYKKKRKTKRK